MLPAGSHLAFPCLKHPRAFSLGNGNAHTGCIFLHQLTIKAVSQWHAYRSTWPDLDHSSLRLLSKVILGCVKLKVATIQCSIWTAGIRSWFPWPLLVDKRIHDAKQWTGPWESMCVAMGSIPSTKTPKWYHTQTYKMTFGYKIHFSTCIYNEYA